MESYRTRRRKLASGSTQSQLPFSDQAHSTHEVALEEAPPEQIPPPGEDDFSFTIAIGRSLGSKPEEDSQFLIDVTAPVSANAEPDSHSQPPQGSPGLYPVAPIEERRLAGMIDVACLLFAYGAFLTLFGSLGGQFTLSKFNAAVYSIAFAIVYFQYFSLFTVFGGTTPGMMLRGLRVVDFSGEQASPRQMLLRAAGYLLSAGTFFLGFLWAMWDEDSLTWHDRLSHTYLSSADTLAEMEMPGAAPLH